MKRDNFNKNKEINYLKNEWDNKDKELNDRKIEHFKEIEDLYNNNDSKLRNYYN